MPEALSQQKIFPWDGAFDATKHPLLISAKDVVDSQNLVYTTYSTKRKRPGLREFLTPTFPGNERILAGIDFWRFQDQFIVLYDGNNIWAIKPGAATWDNLSIKYDLPVDAVCTLTKFQGLLIICFNDGATSPKIWTGSGLLQELSDDAPNGAFCRVWLNKLWMPDPTIPGRILHTETGTINFVGGDAGAIDLDPNDGDPDGVTAIFPPFFYNLYIAKRFKIYKIIRSTIGSDVVYGFNQVSDGIGCNSHSGVAAGPQNVFFTSDEGVHYFVSNDKISEVDSEDFSLSIQPLWTGQTNFKRSQYIQGVYERNLKSYIIVYPSFSRSYPNDAWGYSLVAKKWYRWQEFNQTSVFRYVDSVDKKVKTAFGSSTGKIGFLDFDKTTDYGQPINISVRTGIIAPTGSPDNQYIFHSLTPIFVPQTSGKFRITYKIDGQPIETLEFKMQDIGSGDLLGINFILGQSTLGGIPQVKLDKRNIKGSGMLYELLIEHDGIGDDADGFEMLGVLVDVDTVNKKLGGTRA